jgi:hypothetical protein
VVKRFVDIAALREARAFGYGDQSANWKATLAALRKAVDESDAAPQQTRDRFIESLRRESKLAHDMGQLFEQRLAFC